MNTSLGEEVIDDEHLKEKEILDFERLLINPEVFKFLQWILLAGVKQPHYEFDALLRLLPKVPQWLFAIQNLPYQQYQFSNHLEQWILAYQNSPVSINVELTYACENPSRLEYPCANGSLCMFLIELHRCLTSDQYRIRDYHDTVECNKNHDEYTNYINDLFNLYSRLVVLRIDLSYRKDIADSKTFENIREDLDKMRNNARNHPAFYGLKGYVIKIEYGLHKKIHAHALFFLDAHKRLGTSDVNHAEEIGEYWKKVTTKGDGDYWNCNALKGKYTFNGIGLVNASDMEKRTYLIMIALDYLCKKKEQAIKPRDKPQTKTLTRGDLRNHNPNLGRPRDEK
jgi:hypothetical protein